MLGVWEEEEFNLRQGNGLFEHLGRLSNCGMETTIPPVDSRHG